MHGEELHIVFTLDICKTQTPFTIHPHRAHVSSILCGLLLLASVYGFEVQEARNCQGAVQDVSKDALIEGCNSGDWLARNYTRCR